MLRDNKKAILIWLGFTAQRANPKTHKTSPLPNSFYSYYNPRCHIFSFFSSQPNQPISQSISSHSTLLVFLTSPLGLEFYINLKSQLICSRETNFPHHRHDSNPSHLFSNPNHKSLLNLDIKCSVPILLSVDFKGRERTPLPSLPVSTPNCSEKTWREGQEGRMMLRKMNRGSIVTIFQAINSQ